MDGEEHYRSSISAHVAANLKLKQYPATKHLISVLCGYAALVDKHLSSEGSKIDRQKMNLHERRKRRRFQFPTNILYESPPEIEDLRRWVREAERKSEMNDETKATIREELAAMEQRAICRSQGHDYRFLPEAELRLTDNSFCLHMSAQCKRCGKEEFFFVSVTKKQMKKIGDCRRRLSRRSEGGDA